MYDYEIRHEPSKYAASMVLTTFDQLQEDLEKLEDLFKENGRELPTTFQMVYYPQTKKFSMNMEYDLITEKKGEDISFYYLEWIKNHIGQ